MPPMMPAMAKQDKPDMALEVKVEKKSKMKPMTFKPPKGWASDTDDKMKEGVLKFEEMPDGSCKMISLDGAPFTEDESSEPTPEAMEEQVGGEEDSIPEDMQMEDAIGMLQKRDRKNRY